MSISGSDRRIVEDTPERQIQEEKNILYFYRKDYLYQSTEAYSLVLIYSKEKR